ncbi:acetyl- synthetase-like protein [Lentinula edodes]|uniref:Acetyl-synthetase-like protein n=1 Tax=Lentinula edodes TaxID=5353 RepID=A0A1Q3EN93_LENED|nr:acetyl- synthetase-like protein [Lentinula edodes]
MYTKQFIPPPSTLAVELQFDFHLSHNSDYPVIIHPLGDGTLKTYTYSDIVPAIHRCASFFLSSISVDQGTRPIVAFSTTSDALTYSVVLLGVLRAGMTAFPISPRFSPDIIAHLISVVKPTLSKYRPEVLPMPEYSTIFSEESYSIPETHSRPMDTTALIIHSSGSTSLYPKTIEWSSDFYLTNAQTVDFAPMHLAGKLVGLQSLEPFHSLGLCFLNWLAHAGFVMALLDPGDSASLIPAGPDIIFNNLKQTSPSVIYASAYLLEVWSEDPNKRDFLKSTVVITAGRVLNKSCAKKLLDSNVQLTSGYGSTESGSISIISSLGAQDWDYFCPCLPEVKFVQRNDGLYSMTVVSTPSQSMLCQMPQVDNAMMIGNGRPSVGIIIQVAHGLDIEQKKIIWDHIWQMIKAAYQGNTTLTKLSTEMIIFTNWQKPIPQATKGMPMRVLALEQFETEIHNEAEHGSIMT